MSKTKNRPMMPVLSAILLIIPLLFWGLWILSFSKNPNASQQEKLDAFFVYFPEVIRDELTISLLVLAFSTLAVVFASIGIQRSSGSLRLGGMILITIGLFFILLQLFTMM